MSLYLEVEYNGYIFAPNKTENVNMEAEVIYEIKIGRIIKKFFFIDNAINYYRELIMMNKTPEVCVHLHIENQPNKWVEKII